MRGIGCAKGGKNSDRSPNELPGDGSGLESLLPAGCLGSSCVRDPAGCMGSSCVRDPAVCEIQLCLSSSHTGSSCARLQLLGARSSSSRADPAAHIPAFCPHFGCPRCTPCCARCAVRWLGLGRWSCAAAHGCAGRPGLAAGLQQAEPWLLRGCRSRVRGAPGAALPTLGTMWGCSTAGPPPLSRGAAAGRRRSCVGGTQAVARCDPRGSEGVQPPAVGWGETGAPWLGVLLPVLRPPPQLAHPCGCVRLG